MSLLPNKSHLILGTAGHIDHGKTSLVRILTGIDTDRLPEEKNRGITIELGFAPLNLTSELSIGIVDVPGHEKLIRTMVSGASGIDMVLLVVASDEGVMPQTREHVAICELLGIHSGVIALTKIDTAGPDLTDIAEEEVRHLLQDTNLSNAPIVRVSSNTGEGLEHLRNELTLISKEMRTRIMRHGPARLPVDRMFSAKGFGGIVTGTLLGSSLSVGDHIVLQPGGLEGRIRGLQSFGISENQVGPGARCAVNIQGLEISRISRGMVLTHPNALVPTQVYDAEIHWLKDASRIKKSSSVVILSGTSECLARISPIGAESVGPGDNCYARFHLQSESIALLPGDYFVIRGFSRIDNGGATLGGGRVLDIKPARRRLLDPILYKDLVELAAGQPRGIISLRINRSGFSGIDLQTLVQQTGMDKSHIQNLLEELDKKREASVTSRGLWIGASHVVRLKEKILEALTSFHKQEPIQPGMTRGALSGSLPGNVGPGVFDLLIAQLEDEKKIITEGDHVRDPDHLPILSQVEELLVSHIRAETMSMGLEPPTLREWLEMFEVDEQTVRDLLAYLEREGSLIRAPGDIWFDAITVDALRTRVHDYLLRHQSIDTPTYKRLIGTSRKYAVPLMELFDAQHLTLRRDGLRFPGRHK